MYFQIFINFPFYLKTYTFLQMTYRLYNNRYQIIQELDATPFTRVYKARVVENPTGQEILTKSRK